MAYNVQTNVFEGPFDLLLHLVRIHEMDIYDIPLADITKQYLEYIQEMNNLDLEVAGDFLVMAATLINIKSRTLMPPLTGEEAEQEEEEVDEEYENIRSAQDLMERLIEYRQFKEVATRLSAREEEQVRMFYRNSVLPRVQEDAEQTDEMREDISLLFSAFARILEFAEGRPSHHVTEDEWSVEEKIDSIRKQLVLKRRMSVNEIFSHCIDKQEVITTFLALLELCKQREARIKQAVNFEDMELVLPSEIDDDEEDF